MYNTCYRVYSSFQGWKIIGIKEDLTQVVDLIGSVIKDEPGANYLVIEHNRDFGMDIPIANIYCIEDFLIFKEEYKPKQKRK